MRHISSFLYGKRRIGLQYKGYLIDLDGTMYRGNHEIEGAKKFIHHLNTHAIPYLFITNNSTLTREAVVQKLASFGITTTIHHILTSAVATAKYIKGQNKQAACFIIGEVGLITAFEEAGLTITDQNCDYVIVGLDREITYDKLAKASLLIRQGAQFISTNSDAAIPTEAGLLPGNGSLTAAISTSTGVQPIFVGKPENIIMEEAMKLIGLDRDNVLMIGDNYETDILAGINANIDTLMVLTGFSTLEDLEAVTKKPTYIKKDLIEWMHVK